MGLLGSVMDIGHTTGSANIRVYRNLARNRRSIYRGQNRSLCGSMHFIVIARSSYALIGPN